MKILNFDFVPQTSYNDRMNLSHDIQEYIQSRKQSLEARGRFVDLEYLTKLPLTDIINELLLLEYGYLLNHTTSTQWSVIQIPLEAIQYNDYYAKNHLNKEVVEAYTQTPTLISAIVYKMKNTSKQQPKKFQLIDGYHRVMAAKLRNQEYITVFCNN